MTTSRQKTLRSSAHVRLVSLLKEKRLKAGLSQEEIASAIGWPQPHISILESGERRLDVIEFLKFCKSMNADPIPIIEEILVELEK